MFGIFNRLRTKLSKPVLFGIYGGLGCLLAAILLGEVFLYLTQLPPTPRSTPQSIVMLIDTSASMSQENRISEAKSAALDFIQGRDLSKDKLAVVNFGQTINTVSPLATDANTLNSAIEGLTTNGYFLCPTGVVRCGTPMDRGIEVAANNLQSVRTNRNILLFTDGMPDDSSATLSAAEAARRQKINLIAVATAGADVNYLAQLTGDPKLVFYAQSGQFDRAFQAASQSIDSRQLVESKSTGDYSLVYSALRIGGWTALLTLGIAAPLIIGQNHYLRRRLLTFKEAGLILSGSLLAGLTAGGMGQVLFFSIGDIPYPTAISGTLNWGIAGAIFAGIVCLLRKENNTTQKIAIAAVGATLAGVSVVMSSLVFLGAIVFGLSIFYLFRSKPIAGLTAIALAFGGKLLFYPPLGIPSTLELVGRLLGWTLLGAIAGVGISIFIPNLKQQRGLLGGALGGSLGAIGFLISAGIVADLPGRIVGATILGACIGMMIFWEEARQLKRQAHLLVQWTPTEQTKILLGSQPIWLGTSSEANIPLSKKDGYFPRTAKIFQKGDNIVMEYESEYGRAKGMNLSKLQQQLEDGSRRTLGKITIEVKMIEI
jgi:Ca-activated chloride channel homolog